MVNHGLVSATLFLLAGAVERRTATGRLRRASAAWRRAGRCSRRCCMTVGMISLAVPGSSDVRGRVPRSCRASSGRLGLGGRRRGGDRARRHVHAAPDLGGAAPASRAAVHRERARPAPGRAGDHRAARRAACSPSRSGRRRSPSRSFGPAGSNANPALKEVPPVIRRRTSTGSRSRPELTLLGASASACSSAVLVPRGGRRWVAAFFCGGGFVGRSSRQRSCTRRARTPRRSSPTRSAATAGARSRS